MNSVNTALCKVSYFRYHDNVQRWGRRGRGGEGEKERGERLAKVGRDRAEWGKLGMVFSSDR